VSQPMEGPRFGGATARGPGRAGTISLVCRSTRTDIVEPIRVLRLTKTRRIDGRLNKVGIVNVRYPASEPGAGRNLSSVPTARVTGLAPRAGRQRRALKEPSTSEAVISYTMSAPTTRMVLSENTCQNCPIARAIGPCGARVRRRDSIRGR